MAAVFWVVGGLQYHADSELSELDLVAALQPSYCVRWSRMRGALIYVDVVLVELRCRWTDLVEFMSLVFVV